MKSLFDNSGKAFGFLDQDGNNNGQTNLYNARNEFVGMSNSNGTYDADGTRVAQSGLLGILFGNNDD